jgi:hypothetical protein
MPRIQPRCFHILSALLATLSVQAQDPVKQKFAETQSQNAAELRQYGWTSRTALKVKDEVKDVKWEAVHYDDNGQLQKTTIPDPAPAPPPPDGSKSKQKPLDKKKTEELKGLLGGLAQLARSYAHLTPAQMQAFAQRSTLSQDPNGGYQLQGGNLVADGDNLTLRVDPGTFLTRQLNIQTSYEKNPVTIIASFTMLSDGVAYPSLIDLSYPKKQVEVIVQNSNYQRLRATPPSPTTEAAPPPTEPTWPRQITGDDGTMVVYQPQVDEWEGFRKLTLRMAVSVTPKGGKPAVGALSIEALTDVDNDSHVVTIHDLKIVHMGFPSLEGDAAASMERLVRAFLPPTVTTSLERIVACTPKKDSVPAVQLKSDPPQIFVSYKPAVLLDVDGEPVSVPIRDTSLEYVMNTTWRVMRDKSDSSYYFLAGDQWMKAADLKGPWSAAAALPKDMDKVVQDTHFADLKDFVPLRPAKPGAIVPAVFYTTKPAEVILFDGHPAYQPIAGTQLSYATNTESYVFADAKTKQVYYLTQGRWFSASSLDGPWTIATTTLPEDFAKIPETSPAAQVLASVPGTEEAKDAVLMAQIPTTAVVDPKAAAAEAKATYDGDPKFSPIEGTSLQYATNTANKVIKVEDVYYLCLQGVWFFATTPQGPWQTAPSTPKEVASIPPSSPVYNVTYVTQNTLPSGDVEASYTAGYTGAFVWGVAAGAVIVAGTGYYYPPYIGYYPGYYGYPYYWAAPYTYGAAAYYNSATGRYGVAQTVYGPYGAATRGASYNPYTGTATRGASVATPYGRTSVGQAYNPYTGASAATRQSANAYSQWGNSVVSKNGRSAYTQHYSDARGTVGSIQGSQGGAAIGAAGRNGNSGFAGKTGSGDMYAGRDGNVYRNTGSGWQKYDNGNWNSVNRPSPQGAAGQQSASRQASSAQMDSLRSEAQSRQRGAESSQRFQQRSGGFSGGGFSGARMGGGRRR